ncbi:hypothetical protein Hanom_Chr14g01256741 [Helianthus anomalus]
MPLALRERLNSFFRVPRRLSRVAPGFRWSLAWRGGGSFPVGSYLDLHFLPSSSFDQTLNFKMS